MPSISYTHFLFFFGFPLSLLHWGSSILSQLHASAAIPLLLTCAHHFTSLNFLHKCLSHLFCNYLILDYIQSFIPTNPPNHLNLCNHESSWDLGLLDAPTLWAMQQSQYNQHTLNSPFKTYQDLLINNMQEAFLHFSPSYLDTIGNILIDIPFALYNCIYVFKLLDPWYYCIANGDFFCSSSSTFTELTFQIFSFWPTQPKPLYPKVFLHQSKYY